MKCHIVIVNWNGHEDTEQCLASLIRLQLTNVIVSVIDNSEDHGPIVSLETMYSSVHFVYNNSNVGFAAACNQSLDFQWATCCEIVHFLNNDTVVLCDYISIILSLFLEHTNIAAISPCINYFDEPQKSWFCNSLINRRSGAVVHVQTSPSIPIYDVPWLTGCALFVRVSVFNKLGRFDESLFMYCEDVDFSLKCGLAGHKLAIASELGVLHKVSASAAKVSTKSLFYDVRNKLVMCRRYFGKNYGIRPFVHTFFRELKRVLLRQGWNVQKYMCLVIVVCAAVAAVVFKSESGKYDNEYCGH